MILDAVECLALGNDPRDIPMRDDALMDARDVEMLDDDQISIGGIRLNIN
jgi:hypothetical protein